MISFHSNQSSQINWLSKNIKLNRLSPSLHYLSVISSLLQLSPSLLPHVIPTCLMVSLLTSSVATSLVPLQKPVKMSCQLYPGCYAIRNQIIHCILNRCKRNHLLSTSSLLHYEASVAGSLYSAHQHAPERIIVRPFPYRSPQGMFPSLAA